MLHLLERAASLVRHLNNKFRHACTWDYFRLVTVYHREKLLVAPNLCRTNSLRYPEFYGFWARAADLSAAPETTYASHCPKSPSIVSTPGGGRNRKRSSSTATFSFNWLKRYSVTDPSTCSRMMRDKRLSGVTSTSTWLIRSCIPLGTPRRTMLPGLEGATSGATDNPCNSFSSFVLPSRKLNGDRRSSSLLNGSRRAWRSPGT